MSKARHKRLFRTTAMGIVLLQLAVVPATYEFHLVCHHADAPEDGNCATRHSCSCVHHRTYPSSSNESQSEEPHDGESCRICQAAFALSLASFDPPQLQQLGSVFALDEPEFVAPVPSVQYRSLSRGPPGFSAAS